MKPELVHTLTDTFEAHAQKTESGVEFWLARDLQHLLGYTEWRNFTAVATLNHAQLQGLSDEVGPERSLLVLARCEWGHDHSLQVENLPEAPEVPEHGEYLDALTPGPSPGGRGGKVAAQQELEL